MRFAVLCSPDSWYLRDLLRAAGAKHEITAIPFGGLTSSVDSHEAPRWLCGHSDLADYDAILVRTMPPGSLEQVVFRMDVLNRLEAAGAVVINPARAIEAAVDKYLSLAKLQEAGLTIPRTIVCQSVDEAMSAFQQLAGDVVIKPLFGSEGRGVMRVSDEALALRTFKTLKQLDAVIYIQQFIQHEGCDLRLMIIGQQVLAMRRMNPCDWRTNVSRGATTEPLEPGPELVESARRAAAAVGAPLAGVDLLPACDGKVYVLEVNAVPGWKALSQTLDIDVASLVLDYLKSVACRKNRS